MSICMTVGQPTLQPRMGEVEAVRLGKRLVGQKLAAVLTGRLQGRSEPVIRRGDEMDHERRVGQAHTLDRETK